MNFQTKLQEPVQSNLQNQTQIYGNNLQFNHEHKLKIHTPYTQK